MSYMKQYELRCPNPDCAGGHADRLHVVNGKPEWIPAEIMKLKKENEQIYRCNYCCLVWFQKSSKKPGFDPKIIGFYNNFQNPGKFVPVKNFRIRKENTLYYWDTRRKKRLQRKKKYI